MLVALLGLLVASATAGWTVLRIADMRATTFHWTLETNHGASPREGWAGPGDDEDLPDGTQPRAWDHIGLALLVGVDRLPSGLALHVRGWSPQQRGDAWFGLDGRPLAVERHWSVTFKATSSTVVEQYAFDRVYQVPPPE